MMSNCDRAYLGMYVQYLLSVELGEVGDRGASQLLVLVYFVSKEAAPPICRWYLPTQYRQHGVEAPPRPW